MKICLIRPSTFCNSELRLETKDSGIPGAEETLINFAITLVSLGAQVYVYTSVKEPCLYYDDRLKWYPIQYLNPLDSFDGLVFWSDTIADIERCSSSLPTFGRSFVRMVNQMDDRDVATVASRFDCVLSQSRWYSSKYPSLQTSKTLYLPNGVDPLQFSRPTKSKISGRIFYGSDYDRGLLYLLQHWDSLRSRVDSKSVTGFLAGAVSMR